MKDSIVVFGDLLYDCFIWSERLPRMGETVIGYDSGFFASGKGGNQAAVCAKLGEQTFMLGKVGNDDCGKKVLDIISGSGANTEGVIVDPAQRTGTSCVMVAKDGHNAIVVAPNASVTFTEKEVDSLRPYFERAKMVLFQLQVNIDAIVRAMRTAKECGATIVLNPAPACDVPEEMFALADWVTPNETEAELFSGVYREDMPLEQWRERTAEKLHARGVRRLIITMGEHGAYYSGEGEAFMMPAFSIEPVDSTAAGDAFNGGLAVRLAAGDDVRTAMRFASACGAITTTRKGSLPSLPSREEVIEFLSKHQEV